MAATGLNVRNKQTVLVNQSGRVNRKLDNLLDVDTSNKTDGSILVYNSNQDKFFATTILEKQTLNGGNF
jgi:hypothetical protein